jgi:aspartyl protease family protein
VKIPPKVWAYVAAAAVITLIIVLAVKFPGSLSDQDSQIGFTHSLLLLAVIGGSALAGHRFHNVPVVRYASIWIIIGFVIFAGYSFRDEAQMVFNRLMGELVPQQAQTDGDSVIIRKSSGGHFAAQGRIKGKPVTFLVDTGASDVVLSPVDAKRLGFDLKNLKFTKVYQTANGTVYGAPINLDTISIGPLTINNVRASINSAEMGGSLLGMSFLERLSGYEVRGNSLYLYP